LDFWIEIYRDSIGFDRPVQMPLYSERVSYEEIDLGDYSRYEALIPPFFAEAGQQYWIQTMAIHIFPPNYGVNVSYPMNTPGWGDGQQGYFKSDYFGYPQWTSATDVFAEPYESSFQLYRTSQGISELPGEEGERSLMLFQNSPNPVTHGETMISFRTAGGEGSLRVFDASGRQVRLLWEGTTAAGMKKLYWNCKDEGGVPVQSGVYFYRLVLDGQALSKQMTILR
jgi:hypothetical protein